MDGLCIAEVILRQELYCCVMKGQRKAGDLRSDFVCSCKNSWLLCVLVVKEKHCVLHDQVAERTVSFSDLMSFGELEKNQGALVRKSNKNCNSTCTGGKALLWCEIHELEKQNNLWVMI